MVQSPAGFATLARMDNPMNAKSIDAILAVLMSESSTILSLEPSQVGPDSELSGLGFDSLRFVELLVAIEVNFEVKLIEVDHQPEDSKSLRTLADCISRLS